MNDNTQITTSARVLGPKEGEVLGAPDFRTDRFMIDGKDTGARLSVVEHTLGPHVLAGPLHLHTREDEYSYVLAGRLGALRISRSPRRDRAGRRNHPRASSTR